MPEDALFGHCTLDTVNSFPFLDLIFFGYHYNINFQDKFLFRLIYFCLRSLCFRLNKPIAFQNKLVY